MRQIRSKCRSVSQQVLRLLITSLVLTRLDYGNAMLAGLPSSQLNRLQSVMNAAARLVFSARKSEHITPLLHDLHWLQVPQRIEFKLAVHVYRCSHGMAPPYLARELHRVADIDSRQRLRSRIDICARSAIDASCYHRRPFLWRRRCACMEHSAGRRHVIVITACFKRHLKTFLFTNSHA